MIGPLVSAGANLLSGFLARDAQRDANNANALQAERNMKMQKVFAEEGIRMRVKDARAAGIHPIYALGAQTSTFSPVTVGAIPESGLAAGLANSSQDLSRAFNATRTQPERTEARLATELQLEGLKLDNDIKRATYASAVQRIQQNANPPIPLTGPFEVPEAKKAEEQQPLMLEGNRVITPRYTSPAKAWEDVLGDDITSPGFLPNLIGIIRENTKDMSFTDILRAIDRKTRIW